jgi:hypothetical protein
MPNAGNTWMESGTQEIRNVSKHPEFHLRASASSADQSPGYLQELM